MPHLLRKRRWQTALYCGACVLVWGAWALLYGFPGMVELRAVRADVRQATLNYEILSSTLETLAARLEAARVTERELQGILDALPSEDEIPRVSRVMSLEAAGMGLSVVHTDLAIEEAFGAGGEGRGDLSRLRFTLVVRGEYPQIGRFLDALAEAGRHVECTSVTLSRTEEIGTEIEATIVMNIYSLAVGAQEASGEDPLALADEPGER